MSSGPLLAIGGAEDRIRRRLLLSTFVELAGGPGARIVVIATASALGEAAIVAYRDAFSELGAAEVTGLRPETRTEAADPAGVAAVNNATGVFMTGGNQVKLAAVVAGTPLGEALLMAHRHGTVIAGTSAGASAMAVHMVAFGSGGATPRRRMGQLAAGLGLWPGVIVDQHFSQRNRYGRLLALVADSPSLLGVGIDEDTGAVVRSDVLQVVGRGAVTLLDAADAHSDADDVRASRALMLSGATLHVLTDGHRFDLAQRRLLPRAVPPPEEPPQLAIASDQ